MRTCAHVRARARENFESCARARTRTRKFFGDAHAHARALKILKRCARARTRTRNFKKMRTRTHAHAKISSFLEL
jgi:hypothetical protein